MIDPMQLQQLLGIRVPESQRTSRTTTEETGTRTASTRNMTSEALAALDAYIMQLMSGGTPDMQRQQQERQTEINRGRVNQEQYSKGAAFNDARGAMNQYVRELMEKNMPTLVRSAEGAGTSQNSLRALMTQQLMTQAAQGAATVGLNAASAYGNVGANYAGILERLTQVDNTLPQALAAAFQAAKGAVSNTTETTQGTRVASTVQSALDAALAASGGAQARRGPTSISAPSTGSFGPGPGHSFPQMAGLGGTPSVGGGAAGYSHIRGQQSPGQDSLPAGYDSAAGQTSGFSTPGSETAFWSDRATDRAISEMLGERIV